MQRFEIINTFIRNNNFKNYLEIGVFEGRNIREIIAEHKDGVDPTTELGRSIPEINYPITSDEFFGMLKGHDIKYDIIFIDGLHESHQVDKDIKNSLKVLNEGGRILLHDCSPLSKRAETVPRPGPGVWNGDVWKSIVKFNFHNHQEYIQIYLH